MRLAHRLLRLGACCAVALAATTATVAARPSYASRDETIRGRISSIRGPYDLLVADERGYLDAVRLHDGTVINPIGLTLAPGMRVEIYGRNDGRTFAAEEIDTPYRVERSYVYTPPTYPVYSSLYPYYPSTGPYYSYGWYGAPRYAAPRGYGPSATLIIRSGGGGGRRYGW